VLTAPKMIFATRETASPWASRIVGRLATRGSGGEVLVTTLSSTSRGLIRRRGSGDEDDQEVEQLATHGHDRVEDRDAQADNPEDAGGHRRGGDGRE
jgi:hypothetical protein